MVAKSKNQVYNVNYIFTTKHTPKTIKS